MRQEHSLEKQCKTGKYTRENLASMLKLKSSVLLFNLYRNYKLKLCLPWLGSSYPLSWNTDKNAEKVF
jgi:hypothetical protein